MLLRPLGTITGLGCVTGRGFDRVCGVGRVSRRRSLIFLLFGFIKGLLDAFLILGRGASRTHVTFTSTIVTGDFVFARKVIHERVHFVHEFIRVFTEVRRRGTISRLGTIEGGGRSVGALLLATTLSLVGRRRR